jgi:hypothetical protein
MELDELESLYRSIIRRNEKEETESLYGFGPVHVGYPGYGVKTPER